MIKYLIAAMVIVEHTRPEDFTDDLRARIEGVEDSITFLTTIRAFNSRDTALPLAWTYVQQDQQTVGMFGDGISAAAQTLANLLQPIITSALGPGHKLTVMASHGQIEYEDVVCSRTAPDYMYLSKDELRRVYAQRTLDRLPNFRTYYEVLQLAESVGVLRLVACYDDVHHTEDYGLSLSTEDAHQNSTIRLSFRLDELGLLPSDMLGIEVDGDTNEEYVDVREEIKRIRQLYADAGRALI